LPKDLNPGLSKYSLGKTPEALMATDPRRVKELLLAALDLPDPQARQAFLERECGADTELRQQLEVLLKVLDDPPRTVDRPLAAVSQEEAGAAISSAPAQSPAAVSYQGSAEESGAVIAGRYKLLEQIGEGGMGTVWVAEQMQPVRRKVALKLIKAGMDSKTVLSRFEAERQALALMDHPNIAKVLDGGTAESGRPFFVMEYVKGVPFTQYCDDNRLSVPERLALFVPVCQAVQHAHQKGIIHRDLKPSNILVCLYDGQAVPKVIDFGLAKAMHQPLTDHTLHTAHGVVLGTPLYMSPEQADLNNLDVDTRTDIYALGVILYELLTGTTPLEKQRFKQAAWQEMLRLIKQEEPPRPSARLSSSDSLPSLAAQRKQDPIHLTKLVRGELDWIVMKALEKDRSRRYDTANGFAADVLRYLAGESVQAAPPSSGYRFRKFARRNRTALAIVAGFIMLLAVGTAISIWQAIRATVAESVARNERDVAEKARDREADARRAASEAQAVAERETRVSNYNLYVSQIQLAQRFWEDGDPAAVRRVLSVAVNPHEPGHRGPEWRYLQGLTSEALRSVGCDATAGPVFSPDGRRVATGHRDHIVRVFHADTLEEVQRLRAGGPTITALTFTPDGRSIRTACLSQPPDQGEPTAEIHEWNLGTGLLTRSTQVPRDVLSRCRGALFSSDARLLALSPGQHSLLLWDVEAGRPLQTLQPGIQTINTCFTFSPDGKVIALGDQINRQVIVWDVGTGKLTRRHPIPVGWAADITFRPGGGELLAGTSEGDLVAWDIGTGQQRYAMRVTAGAISALTFGKDGGAIAIADQERKIVVADAATGRPIRTIRGHLHPAQTIVFHPDGRRLLSADGEHLHAWDSRRDQGMTAIDIEGRALSFSPDGRSLAVTAKYETSVFDGYTGEKLTRLGAYTGFGGLHVGVAFGPDDRQLAILSGDGSVRLWDVHAGVRRHVFGQRKATGYFMGPVRVVFDRPRNRVIAWLGDEIQVWEATTGQVVTALKTPRPTCLAISPDGSVLAAGRASGVAELWELRSGARPTELAGHTGTVLAAAFSPDGRHLATAGDDRTVRLWDVAARSVVRTLEGHAASVAAVAFSPDGSRIATASGDTTVRLWDPDTGRELLVLRGHKGAVKDVAFRPDGAAAASVGEDGRTLLWHFPDLSAPSDQLADYLAARLADEEVFSDAVAAATDARADWPGSLKDSVRATAAKFTEAANFGPRLWRFVRRGGYSSENARAARAAEVLRRRFPSDPIARGCLRYALYRTGQFENALAEIRSATGPDEEALRVLANLALKRTPDARRAMAALLETTKAARWADGPLAREVAETVRRASAVGTPDEALGEWDHLVAGAIALLGDDLDHYYTAAELRYARGIVLGRRGQLLVQKKEMAAAEAMLLESQGVLEKARAAHEGVIVPHFDTALWCAFHGLHRFYEAMKRPEEAAKWKAKAGSLWDRILSCTPNAEQPALRASRAIALLQAGMLAEAVAEVAELIRSQESGVRGQQPAGSWYDFACFYAVASTKMPDKKQAYADRAMELLTKAVKEGSLARIIHQAHFH
jgi:WD40 repeat protein